MTTLVGKSLISSEKVTLMPSLHIYLEISHTFRHLLYKSFVGWIVITRYSTQHRIMSLCNPGFEILHSNIHFESAINSQIYV